MIEHHDGDVSHAMDRASLSSINDRNVSDSESNTMIRVMITPPPRQGFGLPTERLYAHYFGVRT